MTTLKTQPAKLKTPAEREETVQADIIRVLTLAGFDILQTSRRGISTQCPTCRTRHKAFGPDGVTEGTPDLFVGHADWGRACWIGVEVKGTNTRVRDEQRAMEANGRIIIVRSLDEALSKLSSIECIVFAQDHALDDWMKGGTGHARRVVLNRKVAI